MCSVVKKISTVPLAAIRETNKFEYADFLRLRKHSAAPWKCRYVLAIHCKCTSKAQSFLPVCVSFEEALLSVSAYLVRLSLSVEPLPASVARLRAGSIVSG